MIVWLIVKILVVIAFLIAFLRRPSLVWGIGLLTITSAVLLDTLLGTFNREQLLANLGFFFYVIGGALVGGMAIWMWGVLRPFLDTAVPAGRIVVPTTPTIRPAAPANIAPAPSSGGGTVYDRQMLYQEIRTRLGYEDVLDLIFDLGIPENEVMTLNQDMDSLIINLMDTAEAQGQTGALALAVERILTPPPPQNLPRLEKINSDAPPTILRHYLLAHYRLPELQQMATQLDVDWEQLDIRSKKSFARAFLQHLYRRDQVTPLVDLMQASAAAPAAAEVEVDDPDA